MSSNLFSQRTLRARPIVIAGPCLAESQDLLFATASYLKELSQKLDFDLIFKSSFDKANRSSASSERGPGMEKALEWLSHIKQKLDLQLLTDVHECIQVKPVAEVCDVLQIPAFLCRQTDLVEATAASGRAVNIKKGQFMAPEGMVHILRKAKLAAEAKGHKVNVALTERGVSFGYHNLVVDMRALYTMAKTGAPVIFDITHSTQQPQAAGTGGEISGGRREFAPLLARAAAATGYLSGFFLEVHLDPNTAKSDAAVQLSFAQAGALLHQIVPLWKACLEFPSVDLEF